MVEHREFTVSVAASESIDVKQYIWEVLTQLEGVNGIERVSVQEEEDGGESRDISEVSRILDGLSDHELNRLEDAIDEYTENNND